MLGGDEIVQASRTPEILADAAYAIFQKPSQQLHGPFPHRRHVPAGEGVTDFEKYRVDPTKPLVPDFFVPDDTPPLSSLR